MPSRDVAAKLDDTLADDFTADELLSLAQFLDTPAGARIAQAHAERLGSGKLDFTLSPDSAFSTHTLQRYEPTSHFVGSIAQFCNLGLKQLLQGRRPITAA
ncbi:protein of unknown function (plasmid) [Cupriavidus taiwanensis]|uniref:Uncharacterized protein n=1 Tax=Cupriavidus taiwanensis TaxID=164546 RepID=A0A7Z7NRS7_9BURK|nr:hypothetical protein CBM2597_U20035 [Cupriavidus taiwanensis]SOZ96741.1 hypothetical protein CBM2598_U20040 [Cupriavidus taiwanensis]SPC26060.1 hypothetical protein CBM2594_U30082 [Cupriavidus taiwanensis]SPD37906.1 protein of unknown function [Cupriavidus taiwanensis]